MVRLVSSMLSASLLALASLQGASAANFKCHGINYNIRAGADWEPTSTRCKPASQIASELQLLKGVTDIIRLYSLTDCDQATAVVPAAIEAGLKVALGLWVDSSASTFAAEKAAYQKLLDTGVVTSDNIEYIIVGSESLYRGDVNVTTALQYYDEIKELSTAAGVTDVPHSVADVVNVYKRYPSLVKKVDVLAINLFPFWSKVDISNAGTVFDGKFTETIELAATYSKEAFVSETGWSSKGLNPSASTASTANHAKFFSDFYTLATQNNWKYFYFSGFDEEWKIATLSANETTEAYFGLFEADGTLKEDIAALEFSSISPASSSASASGSIEVSTIGSDETSASISVASSDEASASASEESSVAAGDDSVEASSGSDVAEGTTSDESSASDAYDYEEEETDATETSSASTSGSGDDIDVVVADDDEVTVSVSDSTSDDGAANSITTDVTEVDSTTDVDANSTTSDVEADSATDDVADFTTTSTVTSTSTAGKQKLCDF